MKKLLMLTCVLFVSIASVSAQDKLKIEVKGDAKPDIYIDGKKYDYAILNLLDQGKIASMNVIKDAAALKEYNSPNGVIIIKTKASADAMVDLEGKKIKITSSDTENQDDKKEPVIVIDGKVVEKGTLEKLSPDDIESINVIKGQKAIDKYDAPNGVIVVKLKKK